MSHLAAVLSISIFLGGIPASGVAEPLAKHGKILSYRITDLGDLTRDRKQSVTFTSGINDHGEIVGRSFNDQLQARAFLWKKGAMTDLGTAPGLSSGLAAFAINHDALVVGGTTGAPPTEPARAIAWDRGRAVELGSFQQSNADTFALAINGHGTIVGSGFDALRQLIALRWVRGIPTGLGSMPDGRIAAQAFGINDRGQVVGYLSAGGPVSFPHAFIWERGRFTDIGTLPHTDLSFANAVNEEGQVVGQSLNSQFPDTSRAFLWENGTMMDLGRVAISHWYSEARAINKNGTVVGTSSGRWAGSAWIWREGVIRDLNTMIALDDPNWAVVRLVTATGINDHDQIVVDGYDRRRGSSVVRGYLLTPVK